MSCRATERDRDKAGLYITYWCLSVPIKNTILQICPYQRPTECLANQPGMCHSFVHHRFCNTCQMRFRWNANWVCDPLNPRTRIREYEVEQSRSQILRTVQYRGGPRVSFLLAPSPMPAMQSQPIPLLLRHLKQLRAPEGIVRGATGWRKTSRG